jgi:hypothetical protein
VLTRSLGGKELGYHPNIMGVEVREAERKKKRKPLQGGQQALEETVVSNG